MGKLARQSIEAGVLERDKTVFWTTVATTDITKTLKVYEQYLETNSAAAAGTVYLPNVAEARGLTYTIHAITVGNAITVKDTPTASGTLDWLGDFTLDTAGDKVVLQSDGRRWLWLNNEEDEIT